MMNKNQTPNASIKCSVSNCTHHCGESQHCCLSTIQVGTHESNPTMCQCTDCESFKMR